MEETKGEEECSIDVLVAFEFCCAVRDLKNNFFCGPLCETVGQHLHTSSTHKHINRQTRQVGLYLQSFILGYVRLWLLWRSLSVTGCLKKWSKKEQELPSSWGGSVEQRVTLWHGVKKNCVRVP